MAVGDGTTAFGGTVEVNDGGGDTFVEVDAVIVCGIPNYSVGVVESKRLKRNIIKKLPTLKKGESFMIKQEFTQAGFARMKGLLGVEKEWRVTVPDDVDDTEITVTGFVTNNKPNDMDPEKITEFDTTVEISDDES